MYLRGGPLCSSLPPKVQQIIMIQTTKEEKMQRIISDEILSSLSLSLEVGLRVKEDLEKSS